MPSTGQLTQSAFQTQFGDDSAVLEASALKVLETGGINPSNIVNAAGGDTLQFQVDLEYRGNNLGIIGARNVRGTVFIEGLGAANEINVPFNAVVVNNPANAPRVTLTTNAINPAVNPGANQIGPGLYRVSAVVHEGPNNNPNIAMTGFLDYIMVTIQ
ncbi:MAG: hypothetical protein QNJ46_06545 [Leptolyngbyaceae cyanobacterium MO_188.B28]|nr:hypothetical protein [Leptolyngbyaceae cyanobacterium MO_188.B28]